MDSENYILRYTIYVGVARCLATDENMRSWGGSTCDRDMYATSAEAQRRHIRPLALCLN